MMSGSLLLPADSFAERTVKDKIDPGGPRGNQEDYGRIRLRLDIRLLACGYARILHR
jgi:hypothetical protein